MRRLGRLLLVVLTFHLAPLAAQTSARAALFSADLDLANAVFDSGLVATLPAALGESGVLVWPGAAVLRGRDAVSRFLASQPLYASAHFLWQPMHIDISRDSTLALMFGIATVDVAGDSNFAGIHRIGRYVAAWERTDGRWQLAALAFVNVLRTGETIWRRVLGPAELPSLQSTGPARAFIAADSAFAADAGALGVSAAFGKWAAPDATTFSQTGELNVGPARVAAVLASNKNHWEWGPVAAGASTDGTLGWTVGQATVTPPGDTPLKSKYLTLWRRMPDGTIRFVADGGNGRP